MKVANLPISAQSIFCVWHLGWYKSNEAMNVIYNHRLLVLRLLFTLLRMKRPVVAFKSKMWRDGHSAQEVWSHITARLHLLCFYFERQYVAFDSYSNSVRTIVHLQLFIFWLRQYPEIIYLWPLVVRTMKHHSFDAKSYHTYLPTNAAFQAMLWQTPPPEMPTSLNPMPNALRDI